MKRRHRTSNYKFTEKVHSRMGITGLILAVFSILTGAGLIIASFKSAGNGSVYMGSIGILALIMAAAALVLAIRSMLEDNRYKTFPIAALIVSLAALGGWAAIYIMGIMGA